MKPATASPGMHLAAAAGWVALLAVTGWAPKDRLTWFLEAAPAMAGFAVLAALSTLEVLVLPKHWWIMGSKT